MKCIGVIPARYGSSRFPGKVLAPLKGKPVILYVIENAKNARCLSEVIVATDDERIASVVAPFCRVVMTREDHNSGTDRIAEVAAKEDCEAVINIQGDEPMLSPQVIEEVVKGLEFAPVSTAASPIKSIDELYNPNVVKVVKTISGRALYFSRYPIPFIREEGRACLKDGGPLYFRHIGIYGYYRDTLLQIVKWPPSMLEVAERLEQLRILEHDIPIYVAVVDWEGIGIDVPEDIGRAERFWENNKLNR